MVTTLNQLKEERKQAVKLVDVIDRAEEWEATHNPFDRTSRMNLFQFVIEPGTGGALVPFTNQTGVAPLVPAIYMKPHAMGQLLSRLDWRKKDYDRLPSKLNVFNLNWLIQNGAYDKDATIRIQDGNQARAILSGVYQPIDTLEFLRMAQPYVPADALVRWDYDDELTMHLSLSFPNTAVDLNVQDIVESGIHFSNSEVGLRSITVAGYAYRLKCKNGQIGGGDGDVFRFRHTGDSERLSGMVKSAIESTMLESTKILAQFKQAINTVVDDSFTVMEKVAKENDVTQEQFKAILEGMMFEDYKGTLMNMSMGVSYASHQFFGEDKFELQKLSTKILGLPVGRPTNQN